MQISDKTYDREMVSLHDLPWEKDWKAKENMVHLKLKFSARMRHFVEEYFDIETVENNLDGSSIVKVSYPENDWAVGFVLSFGCAVEVLEPAEFRAKIRELSLKIYQHYS